MAIEIDDLFFLIKKLVNEHFVGNVQLNFFQGKITNINIAKSINEIKSETKL